MIVWAALVGCTGTATPETVPAVVPATAPAASATPTAPAQGAVAVPAAPAAPPAPGAPPANAADFEPISIPQGPREGAGVKWDGVKTKSTAPIDYGDGEVYDPKLETTRD